MHPCVDMTVRVTSFSPPPLVIIDNESKRNGPKLLILSPSQSGSVGSPFLSQVTGSSVVTSSGMSIVTLTSAPTSATSSVAMTTATSSNTTYTVTQDQQQAVTINVEVCQ